MFYSTTMKEDIDDYKPKEVTKIQFKDFCNIQHINEAKYSYSISKAVRTVIVLQLILTQRKLNTQAKCIFLLFPSLMFTLYVVTTKFHAYISHYVY